MSEIKKIGVYEIVEQVGSGGMATVYKAHQTKLDRYVAVKVMHEMFTQDTDFLSRFEREARIVARLDHPHIVPLYDYDDHNGLPYLVMKYIEGETLKDILKSRALPLDDIRQMVGGVADALTYAHEEGVLHRDIKPSNIMIDTLGHAYLTDFGLARISAQGESTMSVDTMLGTPHYISPEQAQGLPEIDSRTDVYSLGVILYELVVGRVPFIGDSAFAIVHKHIYAEPIAPSELNPELPTEVDRVLLKALAKSPEQRHNTPNDLMKAFESALAASGLKDLDESRISIAQQRAADVSLHTPGGGKYVTVPSRPGQPSNPASLEEWVQDVGERIRDTFQDVRSEIQKREVFNDLASSVREVAEEVQDAIASSTSSGRSRGESPSTSRSIIVLRPNRVEKLIEKDWGMGETSVRHRVNQRIQQRTWFFVHFLAYFLVVVILFAIQPGVQAALAREFTNPVFVAENGGYIAPIATINFALVAALLWGAGILEHALSLFYMSGNRLEKRRQVILHELTTFHGENWQSTITARDYRRVRRRVNRRFDERRHFIGHFFWFIMASISAFAVWPPMREALLEAPDVPPEVQNLLAEPNAVPIIFILFFALTVLLHGLGLAISFLFGNEASERAVRAEIERERSRIERRESISQKRKNDLVVEARQVYDHKAKNNPYDANPPVRLTQDGEFTESFIDELAQDNQQTQR